MSSPLRVSDLNPQIATEFLQSRVAKLIKDYKENNYEFRHRVKGMKNVTLKHVVDDIEELVDSLPLRIIELVNKIDYLHDEKMKEFATMLFLLKQDAEETAEAEFTLRVYAEVIVDLGKYSRGELAQV